MQKPYGRHMFDVLRINSRLRVHAAATRLIYLRAPDDAAAITSIDADKKEETGKRGEKVYVDAVRQ